MRYSNARIAAAIIVLWCAVGVTAHSWVACAKYSDPNGQTYDDTKCQGYARGWSNFVGSIFGEDRGYDYIANENNPCKVPRTSDITAAYTARYPMANYQPGETVCLVWPSKNHVAAPCTNPFIPDNGLLVALSPVNPTADPTMSGFLQHVIANLSTHQNGVIDFKGFQHCPLFCNNMDKSMCEQCFTIPANLPPGYYTMLWWWQFNAGQVYTSCADIKVGSGSSSSSASSSSASSSSGQSQATTTTTTTTTTTQATTAAATTAAATTAAAATTTGSPAPPPVTGSSTGAPAGTMVIYDDAFATGYVSAWSWQATISTVTPGYSGSSALQAQLLPWGGLQIGYSNAGFTWQGKWTKLYFAAKTSQDNYNSVDVWFSAGGTKRAPVSLGTQWSVHTLDLANDLGAPASIFNPAGLVFFNDGPTPITLTVDLIELQ